MKTTLFALIALPVLIGAATPSCADPKSFWDNQDRFSGGLNGR
jgi:hypothetical protein